MSAETPNALHSDVQGAADSLHSRHQQRVPQNELPTSIHASTYQQNTGTSRHVAQQCKHLSPIVPPQTRAPHWHAHHPNFPAASRPINEIFGDAEEQKAVAKDVRNKATSRKEISDGEDAPRKKRRQSSNETLDYLRVRLEK